MSVDYPAAHSMDSAWWAVDRDGRVAFFTTGEAGAMPEMAASEHTLAEDPGPEIARLAQRGRALYDLAGRLTPGREGASEHLRSLDYCPHALMFLHSLDPVREEIAAGTAREVPATEGVAVILQGPQITPERFRHWHEAGACRGCFYHFEYREEGEESAPDLAELGVYVYDHLTENWISGPYGRERCPEKPLHVDQLPPRLRDHLRQMTFDALSFAETLYIQPVEHAPCVSWEAAWLDASGKHIRPMPGQEERYAEEAYDDLENLAGENGIEVEPPAGGARREDDEDDEDRDDDGGGPDVLPFPGRGS